MNTTHEIRLRDGRLLAWCERGDPHGWIVFAFHGLPGSRLQAHPDDGIAQRAGARVIHLDRPGFGHSDAMPGRRLTDWAADVLAVADHLDAETFVIAGVSGGGPFACACATELGERIRRVAIVSSVGPPGSMNGPMSWVVRSAFALAPRYPGVIAAPVALVSRLMANASERYVAILASLLPASDREILTRPEIAAMLARDIRESFRQGSGAFVEDLLIEARPWGIDFSRVGCPVSLWHGALDTVVPKSAAEALARLMPHAAVTILPDAGHFFVFDRWQEILNWLAPA